MLYINTGKPVKLRSLITSGDIRDATILEIYDALGTLIARGNWYQDHMLNWGDFQGIASKAGTGLTVKFKLQ